MEQATAPRVAHGLPDRFWSEVADQLAARIRPQELILAPGEFLALFPGTIASHVRRRMLASVRIDHFVIHKGALDRVDPAFLREASESVPVFANEVFVVFSRRGDPLEDDQRRHLAPFEAYVETLEPPDADPGPIAIVVTTYNRPSALRRTLASLARSGSPMIVVDDGSNLTSRLLNWTIARAHRATYQLCPQNLGLANAFNIGISHWLAHPDVQWISVFNDDVELAADGLNQVKAVAAQSPYPPDRAIYSGFYDPDHPVRDRAVVAGKTVLLVNSCPAKHLHAHRNYWSGVLPVPTAYIGAPKKSGGVFPGHGSDVDWWVASWSPHAAPKLGGQVVVIPDLVSTFALTAAQSTWENPQ